MNGHVVKDGRVTDADLMNGLTLPREAAVEGTLIHAYRHGYSFGADALDSYCVLRDCEWHRSWDGLVTIREN